MADSSKLKQKLDIVSYAVAAALVVAVLALPSFVSSTGSTTQDEVRKRLIKLEEKVTEANRDPAPEIPQWSSEVRALWSVSSSGERASWVTENKPASLRLWNDIPAAVAAHAPGGVVSIELVRDSQKKSPMLRVAGKLSSKNQHIEVEQIVLEKKAGDGEFNKVEGFESVEDFIYEDTDVLPGQTYGYRFVSSAVPAQVADGLPAPILDAAATTMNSNELLIENPVPMDLVVKVGSYADEQIEPKLLGQILYWDYSAAKKVTLRTRGPDGAWGKGFAFGEAHNGKPRFGIRRIVPEKDSKYHGVTIDDHLTGKRIVFKKETTSLPSIDSWDTVESAFEVPDKPEEPEEPGKTGAAKGTAKGTAKPSAKKPVVKPASTEKTATSGKKPKPAKETPKKRPGGRKRPGFE